MKRNSERERAVPESIIREKAEYIATSKRSEDKLNRNKKMITKEKFQSYEAVRQNGVTNMFDVKRVKRLSELEKEDIMDIRKNHSKYSEKFDEKK